MSISFKQEENAKKPSPYKYFYVPQPKKTVIHLDSYAYGMKSRGCSPGCQPKEGFFGKLREDAVAKTKYYDILLYNRRLSKQEREDYDLDELLFSADVTIL